MAPGPLVMLPIVLPATCPPSPCPCCSVAGRYVILRSMTDAPKPRPPVNEPQPDSAPFRNAPYREYMREYMRRYRARKRAAKAKSKPDASCGS